MLAYVFWHRPDAGAEREEYERRLAGFHRALAGAPGLVRSYAHRYDELPWLGDGGPGYEDWYLTPDWERIGELERAAVSGTRAEPHDRAASEAAEGAGGVYGIVAGDLGALADGRRRWFTKPEGTSYAELDAGLRPAIGDGPAALWRRRLVLGPAPEYCLAGEDPGGATKPAGLALAGAAVFSE